MSAQVVKSYKSHQNHKALFPLHLMSYQDMGLQDIIFTMRIQISAARYSSATFTDLPCLYLPCASIHRSLFLPPNIIINFTQQYCKSVPPFTVPIINRGLFRYSEKPGKWGHYCTLMQ